MRRFWTSFAADANLRDALPAGAKCKASKIINASESIVDGSICVENYHAILETVKSSIRDSLKGKGPRVAVLNDEAHHVANAGDAEAKKWKEFLLNPEYGFRVVVGVSGTCYVDDEYFADVVHRYSLRQAIEERFRNMWPRCRRRTTPRRNGNSSPSGMRRGRGSSRRGRFVR